MHLKVKKPRAIIDRKIFHAELNALADAENRVDFSKLKERGEVLIIFKEQLAQGRSVIQKRFESGEASGATTLGAGAYLLDQMIRTLHEFTVSQVYPDLEDEHMSLVATGGYGRGEIAPQSDLDIMFLLHATKTDAVIQAVEWMLYMLWDLGLKVGHATRTVDETVTLAKSDITISTSLLESRWISGDQDLFKIFEKRFEKDVIKGSELAFVKAKLDERDERHNRMGDSRYVLEPNIKDGKGGLRDLQTLFWIAKYLYRVEKVSDLVDHGVLDKVDAMRFTKAQRFLWTVRCHLHYLSGRPDETISFDVQSELANRMDYTDHAGTSAVERFMKHYFLVARNVGDLTRVICAVLEDQHTKKPLLSLPSFNFRKKHIAGFKLERSRLNVTGEDIFKKDPVMMLRLFAEADQYNLDIHPQALRLVQKNLKRIGPKVRKDATANALFMDMLTSAKGPKLVLNRLSESGVLGRFVPDFERVTAQMQYDMYHVYTVDEHTLRAIDILSRIERGLLADDHPVSSQVIRNVQSRRVLYVAVLLHDIAKGRGGDHAVVGAEVAGKLCPQFGLNEWETETVQWLVLHHLDMNRIAYKRDLTDPQTARDFVALVQSPERLRMLLILTVADTRAVGPNVWNGWKASLLRELYFSTQEIMVGSLPTQRRQARSEQICNELVQRLMQKPISWTQQQADQFIALGYPNYFLSYDIDALVHHAQIVQKIEYEQISFYQESKTIEHHDVTEILVHALDHPGLFSCIAGGIALAGANIVDAKIATLGNGMVLDTFWIQDIENHAFTGKKRLERLKSKIEDSVMGRIRPKHELEQERCRRLSSRTEVFEVAPRVLVNNEASQSATVIEVNGRNRQGFLYDVTHTLTQLGLRTTSAHISTYGERVVDVFYVRDIFGLKIDQDSKIKNLRQKVMVAIGDARGEPLGP